MTGKAKEAKLCRMLHRLGGKNRLGMDRMVNVRCVGKLYLPLEAWLRKHWLGISWLMFNHKSRAGGFQTEILWEEEKSLGLHMHDPLNT